MVGLVDFALYLRAQLQPSIGDGVQADPVRLRVSRPPLLGPAIQGGVRAQAVFAPGPRWKHPGKGGGAHAGRAGAAFVPRWRFCPPRFLHVFLLLPLLRPDTCCMY